MILTLGNGITSLPDVAIIWTETSRHLELYKRTLMKKSRIINSIETNFCNMPFSSGPLDIPAREHKPIPKNNRLATFLVLFSLGRHLIHKRLIGIRRMWIDYNPGQNSWDTPVRHYFFSNSTISMLFWFKRQARWIFSSMKQLWTELGEIKICLPSCQLIGVWIVCCTREHLPVSTSFVRDYSFLYPGE